MLSRSMRRVSHACFGLLEISQVSWFTSLTNCAPGNFPMSYSTIALCLQIKDWCEFESEKFSTRIGFLERARHLTESPATSYTFLPTKNRVFSCSMIAEFDPSDDGHNCLQYARWSREVRRHRGSARMGLLQLRHQGIHRSSWYHAGRSHDRCNYSSSHRNPYLHWHFIWKISWKLCIWSSSLRINQGLGCFLFENTTHAIWLCFRVAIRRTTIQRG